jgi:hypothetical protein
MPSDIADLPPPLRRIEAEQLFQERVWLFQRIGWAAMGLVTLAALLGFAGGGGPFSTVEATAPDGGLRIRYDRVQRWASPTVLRAEMPAAGGIAELRLGRDLAELWAVEGVTPPPQTVTEGPDGLLLRFATAPGAPLTVQFRAKPDRAPAMLRSEVAAGGGAPIPLTIWVLP